MTNESTPSAALRRVIAILEFPPIVIGKLAGWLILPLVGALAFEVVSRYLFHKPTIWAYDMTYMLAGTLFMLGTAYALQRGSHVRVDFLFSTLRPRWQALLDLILYLVLYFPAMILFFSVAIKFASQSWAQNELYPQSPWMPPIYPFKTIIPITIGLLLIQGIAEILKASWVIRHNVQFTEKEQQP